MLDFNELFEDKTKYGTKLKTDQYQGNGKNIIVDQGQNDIAGYTNIEEGLFTDVPVIIFGDHTRVVKYVDRPFFLGADGTKILKSKYLDANYKYLYYALKYIRIPNTGYNSHFKWLKKTEFKYPTKEEQMQIVFILDKIANLIQKYTSQIKLLDDVIKARFVEMFGSIHENKIYPYLSVKNITTVYSGGTPNRKKIEYWENGTIPWVKTTELQNNHLSTIEECITKEGLKNSSAKIIPAKSILIAMYGQGKTRGMTAFLDIDSSTNQACACLLSTTNINMEYMWYYFQFSYNKLRGLAKGGNQPNLNLNMIKNFPVLVPPIALQNQFADFVKQVDKSKFEIQKSLKKTQQLYDSLMQKYFG